MKIRWDPKKQNFPGFKGRFTVYSLRGQLHVRSWPRKRGPSKSASVRTQNLWFKNANDLAKRCDPRQMAQAIEMTKGTGLYPRDLLLKCMSSGIVAPITKDGRELQYRRQRVDPVEFQGFELELAVVQNIPLLTEQAIVWPLPIRDTAGFWDVLNPNQITVPAGVTMMSFTSGARTNGAPGGLLMCTVSKPAFLRLARNENDAPGQKAAGCSTGPVSVVAGDVIKAKVFLSLGGGNLAIKETYFRGQILEAT